MLEGLILNGRLESAYRYHDVAVRSFKDELIDSFRKGRRAQFIRLFGLLKGEEKLEFYTRVYFLIYFIHPSLKGKSSIPEEEVTAFREYLDTKGADLAKTNQFLQFYALSFVKKPLQHPSYKILFKKQWVANLTQKLTIFLTSQERRMRQLQIKPQIQHKSLRSPEFVQPSQPSINIKSLEEKNKKLFQEVQHFKRKYSQLQGKNQAIIDSYHGNLMQSQNKWFQITRELTHNSRTLIDLISKANSNIVHQRKYQRIKKRTEKYQKIVKKELDQLLNQSQDLSVFDKPSNNEVSYSASATPNVSQRNITTYITLDEFIPTNYISLIKDFKKMKDQQKISVLQGLSWRIIKSKNKWIRRQTIIGLIVNDVLGIVNGDIQILLFNQNLMPHVLKLFLYISQDSYGRKVLFRNGGLYKQLIDLIPQILAPQHHLSLQITLQILLNIYHNKQIFTQLINLNIIDTCINKLLQDMQIICKDELLQSIATLLLNATLNDQGLNSFEYQVDVFYYLCEAFKVATDTNRNLIGGIIYGLLGRRNLWKLAHQAKLPVFIIDIIRSDQRSNKQQLKLIQAKLHTFQPGNIMDLQDYQEEESIDSNLEEEIFQRNQDELIDLQEYIKGHDMLTAKYPLRNKEAEKQIQQINRIVSQKSHIIQTLPEFPEAKSNDKRDSPKKEEKVNVKLPDLKKKKQAVDIYNPKSKVKASEGKDFYSYKSPNFKQPTDKKNIVSMQAEYNDHFRDFRDASLQKKNVNSFVHQESEYKRAGRVQTTKPSEPVKDSAGKKQERKKVDKKSAQKPEYRIKKSTSVQKGLGNPYKKELAYQSHKNASNADYRSPEGIKSPPQKRTRDEVLKQLNQQLRAQKKAQQQNQRKISSKYISEQVGQRQNILIKKNNNYTTVPQQEVRAFQSKPKIRRTPPKDEQ